MTKHTKHCECRDCTRRALKRLQKILLEAPILDSPLAVYLCHGCRQSSKRVFRIEGNISTISMCPLCVIADR